MQKNLRKMMITLFVLAGFSSAVNAEVVTLSCPSISCTSCKVKITDTLSSIKGIEKESISVDVEKKTVSFDYEKDKKLSKKDKKSAIDNISKELDKLGYAVKGDAVWGEIKKTQK